MNDIVTWWLCIELVGIVGMPLTSVVCSRLPDRGWALAKPLSMLVLGWLIWFPLTLLPVLPYSRIWIVATFVLFGAGNAALLALSSVRASLFAWVRRNRVYVALTEALYLGAFALMLYVRSFNGAVVGTEKFMDVAFLSAIWRAPHLPPPDPWLSGEPINYYYFGHFLVATVAKVLGTVPAVAFNLGVALIFALAVVAVFGVATGIAGASRRSSGVVRARAYVAGLFSVLLALVLGNLASVQAWWKTATQYASPHTPAAYALASPWQWWLRPSLWVNFDWWSPSRVVPNGIDEFPAFSFTLADLHAHVLALPFVVVAAGLALNLLLSDGVGLRLFGERWRGALTLMASALVGGSLYAINGWDLPTYLGLMVLAVLLQQWLTQGCRWTLSLVVDALTASILLAAVAILAFLPFYRGFSSPAQGVGLVPGSIRTPIGDVFAMFGALALLGVSYVCYVAYRALPGRYRYTVFIVCGVLVAVTWATLGYANWVVFWGLLMVLTCAGLILHRVGVFAAAGLGSVSPVRMAERSSLWLLCLIGSAAALVTACEFIYLRDVFGFGANGSLGADFRMNTVFKLYYQAWMLLALAAGPALVELAGHAASMVRRETLYAVTAGTSVAVTPERVLVSGVPLSVTAAQPSEHGTASASPESGEGLGGQAAGEAPAAGVFTAHLHKLAIERMLRVLRAGSIVMWSGLLVATLLGGLLYPLLATASRTQDLRGARTLDGTAFMAHDALVNGDGRAIAWLNAHVSGQPVLVEGASYTEYQEYGRVSAFTGLPTILDWGGHEVQWRYNWLLQPEHAGTLDQRLQDVNTIYTSSDQGKVLALLHSYSAKYLYVGGVERQLYPQANLSRFGQFLPVVYAADGVTIYAIR